MKNPDLILTSRPNSKFQTMKVISVRPRDFVLSSKFTEITPKIWHLAGQPLIPDELWWPNTSSTSVHGFIFQRSGLRLSVCVLSVGMKRDYVMTQSKRSCLLRERKGYSLKLKIYLKKKQSRAWLVRFNNKLEIDLHVSLMFSSFPSTACRLNFQTWPNLDFNCLFWGKYSLFFF